MTAHHRSPLVHMSVFAQKSYVEKESDYKRPIESYSTPYPKGNGEEF